MTKLTTSVEIKAKLQKQWSQFKFHKLWAAKQLEFPLSIKLAKPTDKQLLHEYSQVQVWLDDLQRFTLIKGVTLLKQQVNYSKMGKQFMPVTIEIADIQTLARYLNKWQQWQKFIQLFEQICKQLPLITDWLAQNPAQIEKYQSSWSQLVNVCLYFIKHPTPNCYIRQLDIPNVDTKFIEQHKAILKQLLDQLLDLKYIDQQYNKLTEHGFEKRFGLLHEQPQIRFRVLDPQLSQELLGINDLTIPIEQFNQLNLMVDRVFITENKVNGLAFPAINNAIVIFGLGYGVQILKQTDWLKKCQIHYWGDIDTHGFAILSQLRSYFPKTQSLLMDQQTLLACKTLWGCEVKHQCHKAKQLPHLTDEEQTLYQQLKQGKWAERLRLEQELIPISILLEGLISKKLLPSDFLI